MSVILIITASRVSVRGMGDYSDDVLVNTYYEGSYVEPDSRATNGRLGFTKVKKKLTCLFDENIFCKTNNKVNELH